MKKEDVKVGMMVRISNGVHIGTPWRGAVGTVIEIENNGYYCIIKIRFASPITGKTDWGFGSSDSFEPSSLEEQEKFLDQQKRLEHAMKYL